MKIRNDFVSNSSSSSFICTYNDLDNIDYRGSMHTMDLKQYCDEYGLNDVLGHWYWFDGIPTSSMHFVSDDKFQEHFKDSIWYKLPKTAEADFSEYAALVNNKNARSQKEYGNKLDALKQSLTDKIYNALAPKWKDTVFVCIDATDDRGDEQYMEDVFYRSEKNFSRVFNNH